MSLALCLLVSAANAAHATTFYVRQSGSDSNSGTSPASAFATIARAARALSNPDDGIVVGPGSYAEGDISPVRGGGSARKQVSIVADRDGSVTGDPPGAVVITPPAGASTGFLVLGHRFLAIDGFTINGGADAGIQVRPSATATSSNITITNCQVSGSQKRGIDITAAGEVVVQNNTATNNGSGGIAVSGTTTAGGPFDLSGNQVNDNNGIGIFVDRSRGGSVSGNRAVNNALVGIQVRRSSDMTVSGNTAEDNRDGGIRIDVDGATTGAADNFVVTDNRAARNSRTGIAVVASGDVAVARNTVQSSGAAGISLESTLSPLHPTVEDNLIEQNGAIGLFVDGATDGIIDDNQISGSGSHGLHLRRSARLTVSGNTIGSNASGLRIDGGSDNSGISDDFTLRGNRLENNASSGLEIVAGGALLVSDNVVASNGTGVSITRGALALAATVSGNTIENNHGSGVFVDRAGGGAINANEVFNNTLIGIHARRSSNLEIAQNTVTMNQNGGVRIDAGPQDLGLSESFDVHDNQIDDNRGPALNVIAGGEVRVTRNLARRNDAGIALASGVLAIVPKVSENLVSGSSGAGVLVDQAQGGDVKSNQALSNAGNGIQIRRSAGVGVTSNTANLNLDSGIRIDTGGDVKGVSESFVLQANETSTNGKSGVEIVARGELQVLDGKANGNGGSGISLLASDGELAPLLSRNSTAQNGAHGIVLNQVDGARLSDNSSDHNHEKGIRALGARDIQLTGNIVHDNTTGGIEVGIETDPTTFGSNAVISGNTVNDNLQGGISVASTVTTVASNNQIRKNRGVGLSLTSDADGVVTAEDNVIDTSLFESLLVNGAADATIQRNNIGASGELGIRVAAVKRALLKANVVINGQRGGISLAASERAVVDANQLRRNADVGLLLQGPTAEAVVSGNTLQRNGGGMLLDGIATGRVSGNTADDNLADGIAARSSSALAVINNQIRRSGRNGIAIGTSNLIVGSDFAVRDNQVEDSGSAGITVFARGDVAVDGNRLLRNGSTGLSVQSQGRARLAALGNTVGDSGELGVFALGPVRGRLQDNVVFSNDDSGITLRDTTDVGVINNLVYGNLFDGIAIGTNGQGSPGSVVTNNSVVANGGHGIVLGSGGAGASQRSTVVNNILQDNAMEGIAVAGTSADGYISGFNINVDSYAADTRASLYDLTEPAAFVDADGPDDVLGGAGYADDDFRLQQVRGGQAQDSLGVDGGSADTTALGMTGTTASGDVPDIGRVDIGYHYQALDSAHVSVPPPFMPVYVRANGASGNDGRLPDRALGSIRDAGLAAVNGATVIVGPGRYILAGEPIRVKDHSGRVTFRADRSGAEVGDPAGDVVVDAAGLENGFVIVGSDDVTIDGFHVTNSTTAAIQIRDDADHARVLNNVLFSNDRRGVEVRDADAAEIVNNLIYDNGTGGVQVQGSVASTVSDNTVYDNGADGVLIGGETSEVGTLASAYGAGTASLQVTVRNGDLPPPSGGRVLIGSRDTKLYRILNVAQLAADRIALEISPALLLGHAREDRVLLSNGSEAPATTVVRNIVSGNGSGILAKQNSQEDYTSGGNVAPDGFSANTPRADSDSTADPAFVDADGADNLLGGDSYADDDFHLRQEVSAAVDIWPCVVPPVLGTTRSDGAPDLCDADAGFHYPVN